MGKGRKCPAPKGIDAIYTLRITQPRRATAYRDGNFMRLLTIAPDHDAAYGKRYREAHVVGSSPAEGRQWS